MEKCKPCGRYEIREREVGKVGEAEIPIFHYWKWCKYGNNWCRYVAGKCDKFTVKKPEEGLILNLKSYNMVEGETNERNFNGIAEQNN